MSFALIRLFFGGALKSVIGWLSHRSLWQLVCMALALLLIVQTVRVKSEQRHAHKVEAQLVKCSERQRKLEAESKAQQAEVGKTVDHYITVEKPVIRKQVERIESAPLPGNCKTPQAVMEAGV